MTALPENLKSTFGIDTPAAQVLYKILVQHGDLEAFSDVYDCVGSFQAHLKDLDNLKRYKEFYVELAYDRVVESIDKAARNYPEGLATHLSSVVTAMYRKSLGLAKRRIDPREGT
jgi:hypothetical protein